MAIVKLEETKFKLNLGFLEAETTWKIDEVQKKAAWEVYVELATRITTAELNKGEGLLRESLSSLYSFFPNTRELLKKYGPHIATPANPEETTLGHLMINLLNRVIRPVLSNWHPRLLAWEQQKPNNIDAKLHEDNWEYNDELREELNRIRKQLIEYAEVLGTVSEISNLISN